MIGVEISDRGRISTVYLAPPSLLPSFLPSFLPYDRSLGGRTRAGGRAIEVHAALCCLSRRDLRTVGRTQHARNKADLRSEFPEAEEHKFTSATEIFLRVRTIDILTEHLTQFQWGKIQTEAQKGEGLNPLLTLSNTLVGKLVVTKFSQLCPLVTICLSDKSLH